MKPSRLISPPGTYFVTFDTWQKRRLFVVEPYVRLFLKTLYAYRRQGKFQLHAFVVMPEHVHLLLTPARDVTLERALQLIKGGYSHAFGLEFRRGEVWQRGFTDHRIRDAEDFGAHRVYIHQNPVERGLVDSPELYRYCSAYPGFKLDEPTSGAKALVISCVSGTTEGRALPDFVETRKSARRTREVRATKPGRARVHSCQNDFIDFRLLAAEVCSQA